jgi:hypothetical protein
MAKRHSRRARPNRVIDCQIAQSNYPITRLSNYPIRRCRSVLMRRGARAPLGSRVDLVILRSHVSFNDGLVHTQSSRTVASAERSRGLRCSDNNEPLTARSILTIMAAPARPPSHRGRPLPGGAMKLGGALRAERLSSTAPPGRVVLPLFIVLRAPAAALIGSRQTRRRA